MRREDVKNINFLCSKPRLKAVLDTYLTSYTAFSRLKRNPPLYYNLLPFLPQIMVHNLWTITITSFLSPQSNFLQMFFQTKVYKREFYTKVRSLKWLTYKLKRRLRKSKFVTILTKRVIRITLAEIEEW